MKTAVLKPLFLASILCYVIEVDILIWVSLILLFFLLVIIKFFHSFKKTLPFGLFISLFFLIDNVLSLVLLYILQGHELKVGDPYYILVSLEEYIPFSFLACQALLLGYESVKIPKERWVAFTQDFETLIKKKDIFLLFVIGGFGAFLASFNITGLRFVTSILVSFFSCSLIALALYYKSPTNIYFLGGLLLNVYTTIKGGMFGTLMFFLLYSSLIFFTKSAIAGKKIKWVFLVIIGVVGIWTLALVQNVKHDYRYNISSGKEANAETFTATFKENEKVKGSFDIDFYIPALLRLNQAYLVSAVIEKVPAQEPFARGFTIFTSIRDAFIPRILNQDKEEAGGRMKMKRFTNIELNETTSMNIGLLGEAYANFGKIGSVLFLFLYGLAIALFEKKVLKLSMKQPLILVLFPVFFQQLVGSGTDFLMVFNGVVKSVFFIIILLELINLKNREERKIFSKPMVS